MAKEEWRFHPYNQTGSDYEELSEVFDESIECLNGCMSSRYKDFFLAEIQERLAEVTKVQNTFDKILQALRDWRFLDWFLRDDFIQNQLPTETKLYEKAQGMREQLIEILKQEKFIAVKIGLNEALIDLLPKF